MTVRPGTEADADELIATLSEGFDSFRAFAPPGWEPPDMEAEGARMQAELAKPETWIEVAEVGGAVAGHVAFLRARTHPLGHGLGDDVAHFWQLFVRREFWGAGVASRLMADAIGAARERGFRTMRLFTPEGQGRARRFYEREGWTLYGEPFEAGLGIPLVEYRRELG